jgi:hypothetical protein
MNYVKKIQDIHFLNRCKRNKTIPNFISSKINLSSDLPKNKTVSRNFNNLTFSILNDTLRKHHKDLHFLRNQIAQKKTEMAKLDSEDRGKIDHHLTECLEKLKKNTKLKLIRKFESLSCKNNSELDVTELTSSTDNSDESLSRVTVLSSTSNLPDGTADLLDLGPKFVPSTKTINKHTELDVNVQLAKLAYRLRWKEIHSDQSTNESQSSNTSDVNAYQTIERTIELCHFDKYCKAPETKFQCLESSLQHLKHEVKKVINNINHNLFLPTSIENKEKPSQN